MLAKEADEEQTFYDDECQAYYDVLKELKAGSVVYEIGIRYGRSSAIALSVTRQNNLVYTGIDPFIEWSDSEERWLKLARKIDGPFRYFKMKSEDYAAKYGNSPLLIDCLLVDGDHSYNGVMRDCENFLKHVNLGGHALFHDINNDNIQQAVTEFMKDQPDWKWQRRTNRLDIWRRLL